MAIIVATAALAGAEDSVAVTWAGITTNPPTVSTGVCTSDGGVATADIVPGTLTNTGCTIEPSSRFVGTVELVVSD